MKLMCKLFGHKPDFNPAYDTRPHCIRCDWQDFEFDKWLHRHSARLEEELNKINRSDLDESENVFGEEKQ